MYAKKISIPATDHRSVIFLDDFDKADEEERRHSLLQYPNEITKIVERKHILAVSDNTTTVAALAHQWQRRKKTNYLLHFRAFKSRKFLHESSRDKISGTPQTTVKCHLKYSHNFSPTSCFVHLQIATVVSTMK